ncbi:hypothetical protein [Tepidibacillus marianensis]|uniref:hypothetical protein n=1 Tax=Tepidibacillus marianensis TaxID=3131995 RepID=UPI0030CE8B4E
MQTKSLLTQAFDVRKNLERELMKENEEKATKVEDKTVTWTARLHLTVNSQNLREYESSNQTSGIHETLHEIRCRKTRIHALI